MMYKTFCPRDQACLKCIVNGHRLVDQNIGQKYPLYIIHHALKLMNGIVCLDVEVCCLLQPDSVAPAHVKHIYIRIFLSSLFPVGREKRRALRRERSKMK